MLSTFHGLQALAEYIQFCELLLSSASTDSFLKDGIFMEDIILRTTELTKKYDNRVVVDGLNLEIKKGEIFGLLVFFLHT